MRGVCVGCDYLLALGDRGINLGDANLGTKLLPSFQAIQARADQTVVFSIHACIPCFSPALGANLPTSSLTD